MLNFMSLNVDSCRFIGFSTKDEAYAHRNLYGGRVFISHDGQQAIWFSNKLTLTDVFQHTTHRGMSGMIE